MPSIPITLSVSRYKIKDTLTDILYLIYGAGDGNRTHLLGLEGRCTSRCATPAYKRSLNCEKYSSTHFAVCQILLQIIIDSINLLIINIDVWDNYRWNTAVSSNCSDKRLDIWEQSLESISVYTLLFLALCESENARHSHMPLEFIRI